MAILLPMNEYETNTKEINKQIPVVEFNTAIVCNFKTRSVYSTTEPSKETDFVRSNILNNN